jgi:hypothetical protein
VTNVVLDTEKRRVTKVEYARENGERENLGCALFVDCAGAARMGVRWLQKAGLPPPKVLTYNAQLRYGASKSWREYLTHLTDRMSSLFTRPSLS